MPSALAPCALPTSPAIASYASKIPNITIKACAQHKAPDHLCLASVNCLVRGEESRV